MAAEAALQVESNSRRVNAFCRSGLAADGQTSRAAEVLQEWGEQSRGRRPGLGKPGMMQQQMGRDTEALAAYMSSRSGIPSRTR